MTEGDRLTVHGMQTVLRQELTAAAPVEGEVIGVVRHPDGMNSSGDSYRVFTVMVEGRTGGGEAWKPEPRDGEEAAEDDIPF